MITEVDVITPTITDVSHDKGSNPVSDRSIVLGPEGFDFAPKQYPLAVIENKNTSSSNNLDTNISVESIQPKPYVHEKNEDVIDAEYVVSELEGVEKIQNEMFNAAVKAGVEAGKNNKNPTKSQVRLFSMLEKMSKKSIDVLGKEVRAKYAEKIKAQKTETPQMESQPLLSPEATRAEGIRSQMNKMLEENFFMKKDEYGNLRKEPLTPEMRSILGIMKFAPDGPLLQMHEAWLQNLSNQSPEVVAKTKNEVIKACSDELISGDNSKVVGEALVVYNQANKTDYPIELFVPKVLGNIPGISILGEEKESLFLMFLVALVQSLGAKVPVHQ